MAGNEISLTPDDLKRLMGEERVRTALGEFIESPKLLKLILGINANPSRLIDSDFLLLRAIEYARKSGSTEAFDLLLDTEGIDVDVSHYRNTALGMAIYYTVQSHPKSPYKLDTRLDAEGYLNIAKRLIKAGANTNCEWNEYGTLIYIAAGCDNIEPLKILIENSADVNAQNSEHSRFYRGQTSLMAAAISGQVENMKLLLKKGAAPNILDTPHLAEHFTALMHAAKEAQIKSLEVLADYGVDLNVVDEFGRTALDWADSGRIDASRERKAERNKCVDFLKSRGAKFGKELAAPNPPSIEKPPQFPDSRPG